MSNAELDLEKIAKLVRCNLVWSHAYIQANYSSIPNGLQEDPNAWIAEFRFTLPSGKAERVFHLRGTEEWGAFHVFNARYSIELRPMTKEQAAAFALKCLSKTVLFIKKAGKKVKIAEFPEFGSYAELALKLEASGGEDEFIRRV